MCSGLIGQLQSYPVTCRLSITINKHVVYYISDVFPIVKEGIQLDNGRNGLLLAHLNLLLQAIIRGRLIAFVSRHWYNHTASLSVGITVRSDMIKY